MGSGVEVGRERSKKRERKREEKRKVEKKRREQDKKGREGIGRERREGKGAWRNREILLSWVILVFEVLSNPGISVICSLQMY